MGLRIELYPDASGEQRWRFVDDGNQRNMGGSGEGFTHVDGARLSVLKVVADIKAGDYEIVEVDH